MTSDHQSTPLCAVDGCAIPRRHARSCKDEECRGCLTARAAPGLRICRVHDERARSALAVLPRLHADLTLVLAGSGGRGAGVGQVDGTRDPGLVLDGNVVAIRSLIAERVAQLVAYVVDGRGSSEPAGWSTQQWTVPGAVVFLARHLEWLAASPRAGVYVQEVTSLAREARRLAYRSAPTRTYLGDCPVTVADDGSSRPCGTKVYAHPAAEDDPALLVECQGCGTVEPVDWWQAQIVGTDAAPLLPAGPLVALLSARYLHPVSQATLRTWAAAGKVHRAGRDDKGRTLYDVVEVRAHADTVWTPARHATRRAVR